MGSSDSNKIPFTIALIQLVIYLASVLSSLLLSKFYTKFGRKIALMIGGIFCIITAAFMLFLNSKDSWIMYILAVFIGKIFINRRNGTINGFVDRNKFDF
jgi:MFS family permease